MPFYVSPEQAMKDKADYARKAITRIRSGVVIDYDDGILFVAPNPSRASRIASAQSFAQGSVPYSACIIPSPPSIPGTDTESGPMRGMPPA